MYSIYFDYNTGELISNKHQRLYQNESMHEEILFIIPKMYGKLETQLFTVAFKYVTPGTNTARLEILRLVNDNYRDKYVAYSLPVTTKISHEKGIVKGYLTFQYSEPSEISGVQQTLHIGHSDTINIRIEHVEDYFTDIQSLQTIDRQIALLEEAIQKNERIMNVDNIVVDNNKIYLTSNGERVGDIQTIKHEESDNLVVVNFDGEHDDTEESEVFEF